MGHPLGDTHMVAASLGCNMGGRGVGALLSAYVTKEHPRHAYSELMSSPQIKNWTDNNFS